MAAFDSIWGIYFCFLDSLSLQKLYNGKQKWVIITFHVPHLNKMFPHIFIYAFCGEL